MKRWWLGCAIVIGACAGSGCAKSRGPNAVSSETHFLLRCDGNSCGAGLRCICGACSKACDSDTDCSELSSGASCMKPEDVSCEHIRSCDVECKVNADCAQLSDEHACADGRCRAPEPKAKMPATASDASSDTSSDTPTTCTGPNCNDAGAAPSQTSCQLVDVAAMLSSTPLLDCGQLALGVSSEEQTAAIDCVRNAVAATQPFMLLWALQGSASVLQQGLVGVAGPSELVVYSSFFDSVGTGPIGTAPVGPTSSWFPCTTFSAIADCNELPSHAGDPSCLKCELQTAQECRCIEGSQQTEPLSVDCYTVQTADAGVVASSPSPSIDAPPCGKSSCEFDGVCYPYSTSTEDGCCSCDSISGTCGDTAWCRPASIMIGKRCDTDLDCAWQPNADSGLSCVKNFFGARGVCTRDCNYGCPTGTECVAQLPAYDGTTIPNKCMRQCTTPSDCTDEPDGGVGLGSSCETHGDLTGSYCF